MPAPRRVPAPNPASTKSGRHPILDEPLVNLFNTGLVDGHAGRHRRVRKVASWSPAIIGHTAWFRHRQSDMPTVRQPRDVHRRNANNRADRPAQPTGWGRFVDMA